MKNLVWSISCMLLHWRHNERDGVSNRQHHECLLNRLFRCRSEKTSTLRVTQKMLPFDDVIMIIVLQHRLVLSFNPVVAESGIIRKNYLRNLKFDKNNTDIIFMFLQDNTSRKEVNYFVIMMVWHDIKHFRRYCPFVAGIHWSAMDLQRDVTMELWCLLWCTSKQTIAQTLGGMMTS